MSTTTEIEEDRQAIYEAKLARPECGQLSPHTARLSRWTNCRIYGKSV